MRADPQDAGDVVFAVTPPDLAGFGVLDAADQPARLNCETRQATTTRWLRPLKGMPARAAIGPRSIAGNRAGAARGIGGTGPWIQVSHDLAVTELGDHIRAAET